MYHTVTIQLYTLLYTVKTHPFPCPIFWDILSSILLLRGRWRGVYSLYCRVPFAPPPPWSSNARVGKKRSRLIPEPSPSLYTLIENVVKFLLNRLVCLVKPYHRHDTWLLLFKIKYIFQTVLIVRLFPDAVTGSLVSAHARYFLCVSPDLWCARLAFLMYFLPPSFSN